ncbi:hypothetical protein EGW08_004312 [Elysia chlorotica]|uniref:Small monomeric GTPase n=1 Tax=Elysia chlorotica TaxID=188477 RepID=A0A433U286_ELYCH|nr:hypothetical protein EGW08_004312 [Elysia chlorotica]
MGNRFTRRQYSRDIILMQGLSGSGKTSLLFKLKSGEESQHYGSVRESIDISGDSLLFSDLWLSGSGKTSLLFKLKSGEESQHYGSVRESIDISGDSLLFSDLYGRDKERPMVRLYYSMAKGFVYVIDSSDAELLDEALDELVQHILLDDLTAGTVVLVLANKQDIPGAVTSLDIQQALLRKFNFSSTSASAHTVLVRACSVKTMEGVNEAFEEFAEHLRLRDAGKSKRGLLPLVSEGDGVDTKGGNLGKFDTDDQKESLARAKVKQFLKNPFCFFKV